MYTGVFYCSVLPCGRTSKSSLHSLVDNNPMYSTTIVNWPGFKWSIKVPFLMTSRDYLNLVTSSGHRVNRLQGSILKNSVHCNLPPRETRTWLRLPSSNYLCGQWSGAMYSSILRSSTRFLKLRTSEDSAYTCQYVALLQFTFTSTFTEDNQRNTLVSSQHVYTCKTTCIHES